MKEAIIRTTQILATKKVRSLFALTAIATAAATATIARAGTLCGLSENFDGVTAPALPAGWLATNPQGSVPFWVTSSVSPDTVPNDAFVDDPATISDKTLDTPPIAITSATAQVTFRNYFNTESTFDGGVLEISFAGIPFTDIIAAGGSFVTGGYNASISTMFQSPIAGRQAWSGNSGGYITTIANLGPNAAGRSITLRFRMASDSTVSATGWRVDTISVVDGACASPTPTPTPSPSPPPPVITSPLNELAIVDQPFVYQLEAIGATSFDTGSLPPGLTLLSSQNAIVGNPTATGIFQVGIFASNSGGTTTATLTLTVQLVPPAGPVIISSSAAMGRVGQPFIFRVFTTGGTPAATLSASGLPPGLVIDAVPGVTGLISGTPTAEGSSAVTLTVTDGQFTTSSTLQLTFTIDPAVPVIISPSSALVTPNVPFTYSIVAPSSDPSDPPSFSYFGNLPGGLNFDPATGIISGIYSPLLRESVKGGGPRKPELAGGTLLGSIQLFATNGHGTSTFPLVFLIPSPAVVNISTRLQVGTGDNVLIGGFIIQGNAPEVVIIRAIGPSTGIPGALQDPTLELHDSVGNVVFNDNWRDSQQDLINATGIPPTDNRESAIVIGLDPGNYTAIVAGTNSTTGIALVEVYDLGTASLDISGNARLVNISTRGFVETGDNAMIGGFIIRGQTTRVIGRAIGPSLTASGVQGALQDTVLELHDGSGSLIFSNDDWRSTQEQEIIATGVPPTDDRESAIVANLVPSAYTAIVRGKDNTTGVALVEVYALQ